MGVKDLIKKIARRCVYGAKVSSELFIPFLKKKGIEIGEGTVFYDPISTTIDIQNPKLLKIGKNVRITRGVTILTHDYSWSVISGVYGECLGGVARVSIGDNVLIGVNAVILKGVTIGNNVIIGAGSVVSGNCEDNSVYAGVPARKICTLEEFYVKKKEQTASDIKEILEYIDVSSRSEIKHYLREYACQLDDVFSKEDIEKLMKDTGYFEKCKSFYQNNDLSKMSIDRL